MYEGYPYHPGYFNLPGNMVSIGDRDRLRPFHSENDLVNVGQQYLGLDETKDNKKLMDFFKKRQINYKRKTLDPAENALVCVVCRWVSR